MLGWAIGFFVAALVAAVFGFGGIASAFTGIAIILFLGVPRSLRAFAGVRRLRRHARGDA